ncbi:MAG: chitobiase/beta-hexosaminidase C-terminal domain-containing protein [Bacteroidales bacterium]|nr:chitobiase/beta-hexosaminidase C-terminal domain-containing protein [Bacteroidales bacterium]
MKRNLTFLLTALLLLAGMTSWGQTRAEVVAYTLDGTITGGSNGYATESEITQNDLTWMVMGNTTMNPWRIGGKSLTNENRPIYSTGTLSDDISKIVLTHGTASSVTVNSITLVVSANADFSNPTSTMTGEFVESSTTTFTRPATVSWEGMYYKIIYNLTISATSNKFLQFISAELYKDEGGGQQETVATPTFTPEEGTYYEPQSVSISCATDGATICYTTDGTEPTENSSQYSVPLTISETTTLKAKAFKSGYTASAVAMATYTFPTLVTIAQAKALAVNEYAMVQGIVNFIDNRNVYVQDATGGICLFLNSNTVPSALALGDMVQAYGKRANYNGLFELSNINGGNESEFSILSSGNTLPLAVKTIAEVNEGGSDALQCMRVKIENATIGAINTNGNTPLTQGESAINIYKVPSLTGIEEGDQVDVIGVIGYFNAAQIRVASADDITLIVTPDPVLNLSSTELNDFRYMLGEGPSAAKNFTISGSNLTGDVTMTAPANFELSILPNSDYFDSDELSPVNGTLNETTVNVRLKAGLEVGEYTGNINIVCGELSETIALTGTVTRQPSVLTANPTSLSGFTYEYEQGGPSEVASFLISGDHLTDNVAIYPSENFEVSTFPAEMFQPENPAMVYIPHSGSFYDINITVRLKAGLEVGTYNEQLCVVSQGADTLFVNVTGTVTGTTPPPTPTEGEYVRISDLSQLTDGAYVVFAARFDENASDYYAMTAATTGKPTGVLFTSAMSGSDEVLPASIADEEASYYWIVGVTNNGYTFTNAAGELIGYSSSTNFATGGDNTEWSIELSTAGEATMVPNYTGYIITNVNNELRHFALNSSHNFGPYHSNNLSSSDYNFYLDLFVKTEGIEPPTPVVATPTFTPEAGTYNEPQTVSIACATEGATIHYTLDGSDPTESSPVYSEPISIEETTTIKAIAMKEGYDNSAIAEATYTIQAGSGTVVIFNQDWEEDWHGWTKVSMEGETAEWTIAEHSGNHYAYMNAYQQGVNEDWLISPAFNLDAYANPVLTFITAKNYNGPDIEVYFSNDYDGQNPSTATWQALACQLSEGSWNWVESGEISLDGFNGSNCYIAYKYTSTEDQAAGWEVDDIMLVGQTSETVVTVTPLALTGFNYTEGNGPSAEQSFTVTGLNLSGSITITGASDFEISLASGDDFNAQTTLTLAPVDGNVEETTVYVRMKAGLAVGNYNNENITITCADVDNINVTCSGSVSAAPVPGDDYVRISDVSELAAGNRVILASRYNSTANAYLAVANTLTSGKLGTAEFTSAMNGSDEVIPASILADEESYYWTIDVTADGYTFTNANGQVLSYNSSTNFNFTGNMTDWTITAGVTDTASLVPEYNGFSILNVDTPTRGMALRMTDANSVVGAYSTSNMNNGEYNFFLDIFMQGEGGTPTVAAPTFNPEGGTYYEAQEVTISCATSGATIHYSLNSENGPWTNYNGAISINETATIWAYADKDDYNDSPIVSATYVMNDDVYIIFNQDWEEDWHGWTQVNVEGETAEWTIAEHSGNHYAYMNAYQQGVNEDWLISPAFDLDSYSDVVLTFITAKNYNGPDIEVYFSNDYDGQNPTTATWQALACQLSEGSWNWIESGTISLDAFSGSNCYIAYKYTSTEDQAAGWEVDDILLTSGTAGIPSITATPNVLADFEYDFGQGPSESHSYILTSANLEGEGDITVSVTDNFEISLDNDAFVSNITLEFGEGAIINQPLTIYVRMVAGLNAGSYTGTINHTGGGATATVSLTGIVHGEGESNITAYMPYYIEGNNGTNNNRVPVATAAQLENLEPNTTYRYTNQFVDDNDGPETAGAGNVIYASPDGFYRSTSPSLSTEGGYGEFTTDEEGTAFVWFINEPTANARFTPGNHVYLRIRINDGNDGTTVSQTFTTQDYATVLTFGNERDAYQGTAFYAKSNEAPMGFAALYTDANHMERPVYSTPIETTGVDYGSINQYADFYKELVAGKDGWFGGIIPNNNETGINLIWIYDMNGGSSEYEAIQGQWYPDANTINPNAGLDEPIFIDLTDNSIDEPTEVNVKVMSIGHEFVIENGDDAHYSMTVYNILGQPVMKQQVNAGSSNRISHNLACGVYVIRLENNQNRVSVKIIVR